MMPHSSSFNMFVDAEDVDIDTVDMAVKASVHVVNPAADWKVGDRA